MTKLTAIIALVMLGTTLRASPPMVIGSERAAEQVERGDLLLGELGCINCHAAGEGDAQRFVPRRGPDLSSAGDRWRSAAALERFIAAPHEVKPGTVMPAVKGVNAPAIAAYLMSLRGADRAAEIAGDADRGRELFHSVGCVACHAPETGYRPPWVSEGVELAVDGPAVPLKLAAFYRPAALAAFLRDPLKHRPRGRMPAMKLTAQEAADIAAYLQRGLHHEEQAAAADQELINRGRESFIASGCASCHDLSDAPAQPAKPLSTVDPTSGCLSTQPRIDYHLSDAQRAALAAALKRPTPGTLTAAERVHRILLALNCYACHARGSIGGVSAARLPYFHARGEVDLGLEGALPPPLSHAGFKLQTAAIGRILRGEGDVRPYMATRMPIFDPALTAELPALLEAADLPPELPRIDPRDEGRNHWGRELMGVAGVGCIVCHNLRGERSLGIPALDLVTAPQRLRREWFAQYLIDPQKFRPGTRMPSFWPGGKIMNGEFAKRFPGGTARQIDSIWTYLVEVEQSRLPAGMERTGSFELKPAEAGKPIVFRTFMADAGTHAIAVGFPDGVHAAFDSKQMRWALAWRGRFLDAESTWDDRYTPASLPLGEDVLKLPLHPPLAKLDSAAAEWPAWDDVADQYRFRGYRIGPDGVPTMLYEFAGVAVEDTLRPGADGRSLTRTVTLSGEIGGVYFRGISGGAKPQAAGSTITEELRW